MKSKSLRVLLTLTILLCGSAQAAMVGGLLVSPTSLNFGDVAIDQASALQSVTVTNTTSAPIGPLATNSGTDAPWFVGPGCFGVTLAPGASCSNLYQFAPTALGPQTSSGEQVVINGVSVPLTFIGNGVAAIGAGPRPVTPLVQDFRVRSHFSRYCHEKIC